MSLIYHIAYPADWQDATARGDYRISTRGRTLEEQGFIHAGKSHQVARVADMFYSDQDDLIVLVIDTAALRPELRYEEAPNWDETLPHIYGPLNTDAVVDTLPLRKNADGRFEFTGE